MATALTPIAWQSLSSTASSVTFSSIPGTYRDLRLVVTVATSSAGSALSTRFNSDTGTNYSYVEAHGNGSTTGSSTFASNNSVQTGINIYTDNVNRSIIELNVMDYSATDKHKTVLTKFSLASGTYSGVEIAAHRWANTAAITAVTISGATFAIGSTFALYGIAA